MCVIEAKRAPVGLFHRPAHHGGGGGCSPGLQGDTDCWMQFEEQSQGQQREKLVANLKDQIKKLQKDRDKIKAWCARAPFWLRQSHLLCQRADRRCMQCAYLRCQDAQHASCSFTAFSQRILHAFASVSRRPPYPAASCTLWTQSSFSIFTSKGQIDELDKVAAGMSVRSQVPFDTNTSPASGGNHWSTGH